MVGPHKSLESVKVKFKGLTSFYKKLHFFAYWRPSNREIGIESGQNVHIWVQSIIWRTQTRTETWTLAENWKNRNLGDAYLSLSRAEIFKLKFFHGNGLHLGGRVLEILHLEAKIKPCRFSYPKITGFENRMILLKIDLKWPQNGRRWVFLA